MAGDQGSDRELVLVTGGAGYVGSHTNKLLHQQGYETVIYDNLKYGHKECCRWGTFVPGDLADRDALRALFAEYRFSAVMHFGAFTYVGESVESPEKYYQNNVANTLHLLDAMLEHGVKRLVFSSTCAVYGSPLQIPIPEDHPLNPISPYGRGKQMVETILKDLDTAHGLLYTSLRYFNAAGADPDAEIGEWHNPETHLIPLVLDAAIGKRKGVKIFGTDYDTHDGTCIRDYIHVADLAAAHVAALTHMKKTGASDVFNLGNGNGFSVLQVIDEAKRVTGKGIRVEEVGRRPGDPSTLIGCADKARKVLGWKPRLADISEIIGTAWAWHKRLHTEILRV